MNTYKAFYNQKTTEVKAETSFAAFEEAVKFFKPAKSQRHMVSVVLLEKAGELVVHSTTSIGA